MSDNNEETLKQFVQGQMNDELSRMETFTPELAEQVNQTYRELWRQKIEWLKTRNSQTVEGLR